MKRLLEEQKDKCAILIAQARERGPIGKAAKYDMILGTNDEHFIYFSDEEIAQLKPLIEVQDLDVLYDICCLSPFYYSGVNTETRNNLEFMSSLIAEQNGVIKYLTLKQAGELKKMIEDQLDEYCEFIGKIKINNSNPEIVDFLAKAEAKKILTLLDMQIKKCKKIKEFKNSNLNVVASTSSKPDDSPSSPTPKYRYQYARNKSNGNTNNF